MKNKESNNRIKFAYHLDGWNFENGDRELLGRVGNVVAPTEYAPHMARAIFCPVCFTNLIRVPKDRDRFSNERGPHFSHVVKYKNIKCDLRSKSGNGKRYDTYEEARKAVEDEELVIISGFLEGVPEPLINALGVYDETPVEDSSGPLTDVPLGRHVGEPYSLPSKISSIAGVCRKFNENLFRYYFFPSQKYAYRLLDLLNNVEDVKEQCDSPKLYYAVIKKTFIPAPNPKPHNIRMISLRCNREVKDFTLKETIEISTRKGIAENSNGRIVLVYGRVTESGIGLSFEKLKWGEYALLPHKYNSLLLD
jgi:hypothetical protein